MSQEFILSRGITENLVLSIVLTLVVQKPKHIGVPAERRGSSGGGFRVMKACISLSIATARFSVHSPRVQYTSVQRGSHQIKFVSLIYRPEGGKRCLESSALRRNAGFQASHLGIPRIATASTSVTT